MGLSARILDYPKEERPREKAIKCGIKTLSNAELFTLIIQSGTKNNSALNIANNLLDASKGLLGFIDIDYETLCQIKGIKKASAIKLLAIKEIMVRFENLKYATKEIIRCSEDIYKMYHLKYLEKSNEEIMVLVLNRNNEVKKEVILAMGGLSEVNFDFNIAFKTILKTGYKKFIILHNHPSFNVNPSKEDIYLTNEIKVMANSLHLKMLDHVIIGQNNYYSFKDHDLI